MSTRVARFVAECRLCYLIEEARLAPSAVADRAVEHARAKLLALTVESQMAELRLVSA